MSYEESYEELLQDIKDAEARAQDAEDDLTQAKYRLEEFEQDYAEKEAKI